MDDIKPAPPAAPETPTPAPAWPVLDMVERRVLGVLVEKQKTSKSADAYPLSLNALVTGCNQKSNRDPVLTLGEDEVEERLLRCLKKNLVARVTSTRVMRWRHLLYEAWHVDKLELAILAELLLRGARPRVNCGRGSAAWSPSTTWTRSAPRSSRWWSASW